MAELANRLSKKRIKKLEEEGRTEFIPWGDHKKFFVIIDEKDAYYWNSGIKTTGYYKIIKRDVTKELFLNCLPSFFTG